MSLDSTTAITFLLVLCRTSGWTVALPAIGGKGISAWGRLGLSLSLALFLAGVVPTTSVPVELGGLLAAAITETMIGLTLGWLIRLAVSGIEAAGVLIDFFGGFAASAVFDPMSGQSAAVFARLQMVALGLLLVVSPALHGLIRGFALTYEQVPVGASPSLDSNFWSAVAARDQWHSRVGGRHRGAGARCVVARRGRSRTRVSVRSAGQRVLSRPAAQVAHHVDHGRRNADARSRVSAAVARDRQRPRATSVRLTCATPSASPRPIVATAVADLRR